jgi:PAS domain S-box-containing protein
MTNHKIDQDPKLRVLFFDDSAENTALIVDHLEQCGLSLDYQRVENTEQLRSALEIERDVVLSAYELSGFNSLEGLAVVKQLGQDLPFIIISDITSEEEVVTAMRSGVHDCVSRENLSRLCVVIEREVRDAKIRRAHHVAQSELKAQNDFNHAIIDMVTDYIFTCRINSQKEVIDLVINQAFLEVNGFTTEETKDPEWLISNLITDDAQVIDNSIDKLLKMKSCDFDFRMKTKTGKLLWMHAIARPLRQFADGTIEVVGALQNISGRKQNDLEREVLITQLKAANTVLLKQADELQNRSNEMTLIFETVSDAIVMYDASGVIVRANPYAVSGYGLNPTGMNYLELIQSLTLKNEKGLPQTKAEFIFPRLTQGETIHTQITQMVNANGQKVWQLLSAAPIFENGRFTGGLVTWKDITAIENARYLLEEQERTLRGVIENSLDGIVLTDEKGLILAWSNGQEQITGVKSGDALGCTIWEVQSKLHYLEGKPKQIKRIVRQQVQSALTTGSSQWVDKNIEYTLRNKNGTLRILESNLFIIPTAKGFRLGAITRDVTVRKTAENQIREARDFYLRLFEKFPALVWRADKEGRLDYINQTWIDFTGHPVEAILGNGWLDFVHPEDREAAFGNYLAAVRNQEPYQTQYRFLRNDGNYRWINDTGQPFNDPANNYTGYIGACFDVHDTIEHQREMEVMLAVSAALRTAGSPEEIMRILLDKLMVLVDSKGAVIMTPSADRENLVIRIGRGTCATLTDNQISINGSLSGKVYIHREANINLDLSESPPFLADGCDESQKYALIEPLLVQENVIGVLWAARERLFSAEEYRLVRAVADIAATAIHRTTLNEETRLYAQKLSAIGALGRAMAETLDSRGIYGLLNQSITNILENIDSVIVSRYIQEDSRIECDFLMREGKILDHQTLPPMPLDPSGHGSQSWVILNRRHKIVNNLPHSIQRPIVYPQIERLPLSALYVPMIAEGRVLGVLQVQSFKNQRFGENEAELLGLMANTAAIAIDNAELFSNLQKANQDLIRAYDTTLEGWALALELRDHETRGHSHDVVELTVRVALAAGIPEEETSNIRRGALLHDIGKMGVPDKILFKEGPLDEQEWVIMRKHPVYAYNLLNKIDFLGSALEIPYCHHEHWDGNGYPRGLTGKNIPLSARIFALVDVWNALQRDRPYRKAWSREKTIEYIRERAGKQFDPSLVDLFLRIANQPF